MYIDLQKTEDVYLICNKLKLDIKTYGMLDINNDLSNHYKTNLTYHKVIMSDKLPDCTAFSREDYDIFKCKKAKLYYTQTDLCDFKTSQWENSDKKNKLLFAISSITGVKIFNMHTKAAEGMNLYEFKHIEYLKRKPQIFVLLSDSLEYLNDNQPKPSILQVDKLKLFNNIYRPSIEVTLHSIGFGLEHGFGDIALKEDAVVLRVGLSKSLRREILLKMKDHLPMILEEVTNNKFNKTLTEINVNVDRLIDDIANSFDMLYTTSLDVDTKNIL